MNSLFRPVNDTAEGTEHLFRMEGSYPFQGIHNGIDILILRHISYLFVDEQISRKEPSLIRFVKTDMVICMSRSRNHHKVELPGLNL